MGLGDGGGGGNGGCARLLADRFLEGRGGGGNGCASHFARGASYEATSPVPSAWVKPGSDFPFDAAATTPVPSASDKPGSDVPFAATTSTTPSPSAWVKPGSDTSALGTSPRTGASPGGDTKSKCVPGAVSLKTMANCDKQTSKGNCKPTALTQLHEWLPTSHALLPNLNPQTLLVMVGN